MSIEMTFHRNLHQNKCYQCYGLFKRARGRGIPTILLKIVISEVLRFLFWTARNFCPSCKTCKTCKTWMLFKLEGQQNNQKRSMLFMRTMLTQAALSRFFKALGIVGHFKTVPIKGQH